MEFQNKQEDNVANIDAMIDYIFSDKAKRPVVERVLGDLAFSIRTVRQLKRLLPPARSDDADKREWFACVCMESTAPVGPFADCLIDLLDSERRWTVYCAYSALCRFWPDLSPMQRARFLSLYPDIDPWRFSGVESFEESFPKANGPSDRQFVCQAASASALPAMR